MNNFNLTPAGCKHSPEDNGSKVTEALLKKPADSSLKQPATSELMANNGSANASVSLLQNALARERRINQALLAAQIDHMNSGISPHKVATDNSFERLLLQNKLHQQGQLNPGLLAFPKSIQEKEHRILTAAAAAAAGINSGLVGSGAAALLPQPLAHLPPRAHLSQTTRPALLSSVGTGLYGSDLATDILGASSLSQMLGQRNLLARAPLHFASSANDVGVPLLPQNDVSNIEHHFQRRGGMMTFPEKLHRLLLDLEKQRGGTEIASFLPHGRAFVIHKTKEFVQYVMPNYFRMTCFPSFQRQLNLYDFKRIMHGPDEGAYYHDLFVYDAPNLCSKIKRKQKK